jgi:DNA-binding NarL/FixJ family response regulator
VVGEAEDAIDALEAVEELAPDVAIVDITLKDTYAIEYTLREGGRGAAGA